MNKMMGDTTRKALRVCMLKPMEAEHSTIHLNSGRNAVGRSKETGIRDPRCSKSQLQLDVNLDVGRIKLKILGLNPSGVNGLMALHDTESQLEHGDVVEVVYGRHPFEVVFKPPPSEKTQSEEAKAEDEIEAVLSESWDSVEDGKMMTFTSSGVKAAEKIAAYDIDGTIIKTKSGNVFPKTTDDWQIIFPEVPGKLKRLHEDGYKICFFTNQGGIAKGKVKLDDFKQKVRLIIKKLGIPVQVFIAIADGYYRKPLPGMWQHLQEHKNGGVQLRPEKCFYVGDAAGRPELGSGATKRRKDHSLADRSFASNIGISFYTPEEHFLGRKVEDWNKLDFEPSCVHENLPLLEPETAQILSPECEMIIMVGLPGSGKSHFTQTHLAPLGYRIANSDTLGSRDSCLKACESALNANKSCVVDNTNVDVESRKKFVELAKRMKIPCRCFLMNATLGQVKHNIAFRHLTDQSHTKIKEMILNMMKKKFKAPTLDEGFDAIVRVNLKPEFNNAKHEQLYKLYLVEK